MNAVYTDGIEMLPLYSIASLAGIYTPIDPKAKVIELKNDKTDIKITLGNKQAWVNGIYSDMEAAPAIIDNTVYIPADFIISALEGIVSWDDTAKKATTVIQTKEDAATATLPTQDGKPSIISYNIEKSLINGNLMLVNKWNTVSNRFVPDNLTSLFDKNGKYLIPSTNHSAQLKKEALNAAINMFKAASSAGVKNLVVSSTYRSYSLQSTTYRNKIGFYRNFYRDKEAEEKAAMIVAPPGSSEHQTGFAMDVTSKKMLSSMAPLSEGFANTPEGKWVYGNSWKYGYIVRYTPDKTKITGIISEPWHLRYVGLPHAEIMYKNKMCLEEYLEYMKKTGYLKFKTSIGTEYETFYIHVPSTAKTLTLSYYGTQKYDISSYGKGAYIVTKRL